LEKGAAGSPLLLTHDGLTNPGTSRDLASRLPDFLGLAPGVYDEKEIEVAILRELEAFILELGTDFAFVARQKRISVDRVDYYLDLLFYHRGLHRLVAIELKIGRFEAADKGQMELYLRWLEKYETRPGEEPPIGLIFCAGKSDDHVELLQLDSSGIRVAKYLTELPPRELLEKSCTSRSAAPASGIPRPGAINRNASSRPTSPRHGPGTEERAGRKIHDPIATRPTGQGSVARPELRSRVRAHHRSARIVSRA
jgi:hypothetical protein